MSYLEVDFDYLLNGFSEKTMISVRVYNQQFQGTIILMVSWVFVW